MKMFKRLVKRTLILVWCGASALPSQPFLGLQEGQQALRNNLIDTPSPHPSTPAEEDVRVERLKTC